MKWKKELDELKEDWKKYSLLTKIISSILFFISLSSITSLSDKIFKWKGFISDGMLFYRDYVKYPINESLRYFGFNVNRDSIDLLIIISTICGAHIRYFKYLEVSEVWKDSSQTIKMFGVIWIGSVWVLLNPKYNQFIYFGVFILSFLLVYTTIIERKAPKNLLVLYLPIILCLLVILLLGAINSGLSKTE